MKSIVSLAVATIIVGGLLVVALSNVNDDQARLIPKDQERVSIGVRDGVWRGNVFAFTLPKVYNNFLDSSTSRREIIKMRQAKGELLISGQKLLPGESLETSFPPFLEKVKITSIFGEKGVYLEEGDLISFTFVRTGVLYEVSVSGKNPRVLLEETLASIRSLP